MQETILAQKSSQGSLCPFQAGAEMGSQDPSGRFTLFPHSGDNSFSARCPGMAGYEPRAQRWATGIVEGADGSPQPCQSSQQTQNYEDLSKEPPKVRAYLASFCCFLNGKIYRTFTILSVQRLQFNGLSTFTMLCSQHRHLSPDGSFQILYPLNYHSQFPPLP